MSAPQLEIYIQLIPYGNFTQKMSIIKSPKQELAEHLELESVVEVGLIEVAVKGWKTSQNVAANNIF